MKPNPHIALIYHYDLARALNGEVVDWQVIPVNVDAGREGGDLCRAAADFAKRRDLFAMPAPTIAAPAVVAVEQQAAEPGPATELALRVPVSAVTIAAPAAPNAVGQPVAEPEPVAPARSAAHGSADNDDVDTWASLTDRDRLRARIADLIDAGHEGTIRRHWPEGVAPLSKPGHTYEDLGCILDAIRRVETEVGAPWHPDDGPPPHVNTNPRAEVAYPAAAGVDEGGPIADGQMILLNLAFSDLYSNEQELCHQIASEAHAAGRSISVSANPTRRRWTIARAVIAWAASGRSVDDLWFTASLLATFEQTRDPAATLGGLISQFSISQAERLYEAAGQ